jgi:hypothetical protein
VAVVLEMGRRLSAEPLQHTEVWLVTTGAEETDHSGIHALMREHRSLLRGASPLAPAFVVLEGVGSGELVYLTRQGLCARFGPDPRLLDLAQQVADEQPEMDARPAQMHMEDDTGSLRRSGYQAICIAGRDPQTGTLPHWHRADDTVETISAGFMTRAADFASALLAKLDTR